VTYIETSSDYILEHQRADAGEMIFVIFAVFVMSLSVRRR